MHLWTAPIQQISPFAGYVLTQLAGVASPLRARGKPNRAPGACDGAPVHRKLWHIYGETPDQVQMSTVLFDDSDLVTQMLQVGHCTQWNMKHLNAQGSNFLFSIAGTS